MNPPGKGKEKTPHLIPIIDRGLATETKEGTEAMESEKSIS